MTLKPTLAALGAAVALTWVGGQTLAQPAPLPVPEAAPATPPPAWAHTASSMTRLMETARPAGPAAYATLSGDFDKQGLSVGTMQWNFGQGTIADLIDKVANADEVAAATMPTYGTGFLAQARASRSPDTRPDALAFVRSHQKKNVVDADFRAEVEAFLTDPAVMAAQDSFEADYQNQAWKLAVKWATEVQGRPMPTFAEFAFFYDLNVQGGPGYLTEIRALIARFARAKDKTGDRAKSFASRAKTTAGFVSMNEGLPCKIPGYARPSGAAGQIWDGQANCAIWRGLMTKPGMGAEPELLMLAFVRSLLVSEQWEINFYNRKGLFAFGRGVANGRSCDFRPVYAALEADGEAVTDRIVDSCWAPKPDPNGPMTKPAP